MRRCLLDPLEEQFDLPAAFVESADDGGGRVELVGEEDKYLPVSGSAEADRRKWWDNPCELP